MIYFLVNGAGLGLTAGLSPGPLMTLLLAESLRGGWPAGFRVSVAPLVTDSVLVSLALLVAAPLPPWGIAVISVIGGGILMWMGWGTIRSRPAETAVGASTTAVGNPLGKAIATNLMNPQAFIFWLTVGGPILRDAYGRAGVAGPLSFMGAFFAVMISINFVLAFSISRGRHLLKGPGYQWTLRGAGLILVLLGISRAWAGITALI
ncbi:MAG TPA: LysE family translocator [Symbiobacteriaceae bacterium]|nr:LysE family translocator [Symbiobacteriaceae bacterium]